MVRKPSFLLTQIAAVVGGVALLAVAGLGSLIAFGTMKVRPLQDEPIRNLPGAPQVKPGQTLKVMSWNVQYMAGKNHVFWYDVQGNKGPDLRPTSDELLETLAKVAQVIRAENPDIVLLQEVDDGCGRSDEVDQLSALLALLPREYAHHASAFYWKAAFVPHPKVLGPAGMKLSVFSKYALGSARRHALADVPRLPFMQPFNIRRAMLEVRLPLQGGGEFAVVDTHLEAFVEGSTVMQTQVKQLDSLLRGLNAAGVPWVAGGDLNLLPPGEYPRLQAKERWLYNPNSEMELLYKNHAVLPSLADATGPEREKFWTHAPNRPWVQGRDRVIDYLLHSPTVGAANHRVVREGTARLSDHMPVIAEFTVPRVAVP